MNLTYQNILDAAARPYVPDELDLFPRIAARLERKSFMQTLRARPVLAILVVLLALILLSGVVYAIGRSLGYLPGVGFVEPSSLRVLTEPVSQTRGGVTVSIAQVVADSERTVVIYKTEGLTIEAANSAGEGGGNPFGSTHLLRLPDGTTLEETPFEGYGGTPEPVLNDIQTEGGWPNYVYRVVYPAVDPGVNELTLIIPVLKNMPIGAAPENWEIPFRLKPAPPEMTFAPLFQFTPQVEAAGTGTSSPAATSSGSSTNISSLNGFTLRLDNVIETQDGFVFTGDTSWNTTQYPPEKVTVGWDMAPTLTDASGQQIPIEPVQVDAPYAEGHHPWSYETNQKAFAGPLTFSIPSIQTTFFAPEVDFEIDLGSSPQIGQIWELNHDFQIEGHTLRLLSVQLENAPAGSGGGGGPNGPCIQETAMLEFSFAADGGGVGALVNDTVPEPIPAGGCIAGGGGGGGGGGPNDATLDPTKFTIGVGYLNIPKGQHRFSIVASTPRVITGPWQVSWQPPATSEATTTPEPQVCLTQETWKALIERNDPLPAGLGGKILLTVDEGGLLPGIYLEQLDGSGAQKFGSGSWPSLSPDGTRLVYGSADALHTLDLTTGQSTSFINDGYAHHWSPDDTRLLYTTTFGLYVINADGTGKRQIDTGPATAVSVVGWLPDNQTIVYGAMGGAGYTFTTYSLQSGETKRLFTIQNKAGYGALSPDGQWIVFADRVFGADNWGIFISRLDGSDRKLVAAPDVPTAFMSVWGPDGQWLILNTQAEDGTDMPVLVNPFTCQAGRLSNIKGMVAAWSP
jgi:hypothetical protein